MATGIRKNAEVAVRSGVKYILFMEGEDEIYESIDEYLKSLKPLPSPYLQNGKLSAKAKRGKNKMCIRDRNTVECKAFETRDAIAKGATEIDTVINVRALQKGQTEIVKKEIEDMVSICKPAGVICKVILETCYLTDEEKETVCRIAKEAGVDFVKTSTRCV